MKRIIYLLFVLSLALSACGQKAQPTITPLPTISPLDRQTRVFDTLWSALNDQYLYADFGGVNWELLRTEYQSKIKGGLTHPQFEEAMSALVGNLPPDSVVYQTRTERIEIELQDTSLYSGIGAYISVRNEPKPHIVIMSIIEGSPAEAAGLLPHDSIYSIDGNPVTAEEGLDVVRRVRGEEGATVTLEVGSPDGSRHTVKVTRAKLTAADALKGGLFADTGIVYLRLPVTADSSMLNQIAGNLDEFGKRSELRGIILDLRVARSGSGWPLAEMLALFGNGDLGKFYMRNDSTPIKIEGVNISGSQTLRLALIVGPDTEGLVEIFAAALQDSGRATVIGLPTPGKFFGYQTVSLPDGSRLTFAVSSYETDSGRDLGEFGVEPDVKVDADWDEVDAENDPAIEMAFEIILK